MRKYLKKPILLIFPALVLAVLAVWPPSRVAQAVVAPSTSDATNKTAYTARLIGSLYSTQGYASFSYGTTNSLGTSVLPSSSGGLGVYANISGLLPNTRYYFALSQEIDEGYCNGPNPQQCAPEDWVPDLKTEWGNTLYFTTLYAPPVLNTPSSVAQQLPANSPANNSWVWTMYQLTAYCADPNAGQVTFTAAANSFEVEFEGAVSPTANSATSLPLTRTDCAQAPLVFRGSGSLPMVSVNVYIGYNGSHAVSVLPGDFPVRFQAFDSHNQASDVVPATLTIVTPDFDISCSSDSNLPLPDGCNYSATSGSAVQGKTLTITNTGSVDIGWNALDENKSWLRLSQAVGVTKKVGDPAGNTSEISFTVNPSALAAGTYSDTITVTANGETRTKEVSFTIGAQNTNFSCTNSCNFVALAGNSSPPQTLTIGNTGASSANWAINSIPSWLSHSSGPICGSDSDRTCSGSIPPGGTSAPIGFKVKDDAAKGNHSGVIQVTVADLKSFIPVNAAVGQAIVIDASIWTITRVRPPADSLSDPVTLDLNRRFIGKADYTFPDSLPSNLRSRSIYAPSSATADPPRPRLGAYTATLMITTSSGGTATATKDFSVNEAPPDVPANVTLVSPQCETMLVSWDAVSGAVSYKVYRNTVNTKPNTAIANTDGTSFTDTPAPDSYYYWVTAVNSSGGESAGAAANNNPVAVRACVADLLSSDKDIIKVNGSPVSSPLPGQCDNTNRLSSSIANALKLGDKITFQINLCNDSGARPASNITVTDRLYFLAKPPDSGGWNAVYNGNPITPVESGLSPGQILTFDLTAAGNNIPAESRRILTFDAVLAVPPDTLGVRSRMRNCYDLSYNSTLSATDICTLWWPFYIGKATPTIKEIAP